MKKEEQFNDIVKDNSEKILRICRYYSPDNDSCYDLSQEVLINVWKNLDKFRGDSAISTWIYRIAVNTCLTFVSKNSKYTGVVLKVDPVNLALLSENDEHNEIEDKIKIEEQSDLLQNELNTLSVIDKALISLVMEGLSTREISDVIGITEPNVRTKISRIKGDLRNKLNLKSK